MEIIPSESRTRSSWFIVKDNAGGMTEDELAKAMTVAHSDKTKKGNMIGSYGFGLKSAAMYIGRKFRIYTCSHKQSRNIWYLEFDREKFENSAGEAWQIEIKKMSKTEAAKQGVTFKDGHGTEIKILNERYRSANKDGIVRRLSRIFGPRLQKLRGSLGIDLPPSERMILEFKGEELKASGPFYNPYKKPGEEQLELRLGERDKEDFKISEKLKGVQKDAAVFPNGTYSGYKIIEIKRTKIGDSKYVEGVVGILDTGMAHNNHYGFDLIKNGRVIETHVLDRDSKSKRIGLIASNHNARIVGQLKMDDLNWKTDHQKTEFMKDDDDWITLAELIHKKIAPLYKISSNLQYPNKEKNKKSQAASLATKVFEVALPEINKSVQRSSRSTEVKEALKSFVNSESEERASKAKKKKPKSVSQITSVKFHLDYSHEGVDGPLVSKRESTIKGKKVFTIKLNLDHPFLSKRESAELKVLGEFLSLDSQSEYFLKGRSGYLYDDFYEIRETVLKEYKP